MERNELLHKIAMLEIEIMRLNNVIIELKNKLLINQINKISC